MIYLRILRLVFNILCSLFISLLFLVGVWTRNLHWLLLTVPVGLWVAAFKKKTAGWLAWGFLASIAAIAIWVFLPDNNEDWRPYDFNYEVKDLEEKRAVPDEQNADLVYQKISGQIDYNDAPPFFNDGNEPSTHIAWKSSEHPETAAFIDRYSDLINESIAASKMEGCSFSPLYTPLDITKTELSGLRKIAYLLISAGNRNLGDGMIDQALEKYISAVRMGRQIKQQPALIYFLVGAAIEQLGYSRLNTVIVEHNLNNTQIQYIRREIPTNEYTSKDLISRVLPYEKLFSKNMLVMLIYEINNEGKVRFTRNPIRYLEEVMPQQKTTYIHKKLIKLASLGGYFVWPQNPKKLGRIFDEEFKKAQNRHAEEQFNVKSFIVNPWRTLASFSAGMLFQAYDKIQEIISRAASASRGTHILMAMKEFRNEYNRWPLSLDEIKDKLSAELLIDPFSEKAFKYIIKGEKFLLYSVGPNKIDEKGYPKPGWRDDSFGSEMAAADDILIWPKSRKEVQAFYDGNDASK